MKEDINDEIWNDAIKKYYPKNGNMYLQFLENDEGSIMSNVEVNGISVRKAVGVLSKIIVELLSKEENKQVKQMIIGDLLMDISIFAKQEGMI